MRGVRVLQSKLVRQINNEPRIASRGAVAYTLGIDQQNTCIGMVFGQSAGGSQPGKSSTDYRVVSSLFALQALAGRLLRQGAVPAASRIVIWQIDFLVMHSGALRLRPVEQAGRIAASCCVVPVLGGLAGQNLPVPRLR